MSFIHLSLAHLVVRAHETSTGQLGPLGARYVMDGHASEGRFALIEHPIAPRGFLDPFYSEFDGATRVPMRASKRRGRRERTERWNRPMAVSSKRSVTNSNFTPQPSASSKSTPMWS